VIAGRSFRIVIALTCLSAASATGVEISAELSAATASLDEEVTLIVTIVDGRRIEPVGIPSSADLTIRQVGPPSEQSQMEWINGRVRQWRRVTYSYSVAPRRTGRLTVPALAYVVDGQRVETRPLTLVVGKTQRGRPLIVEIETDQREAFVEEPVRAVLRVWIRVYRQSPGIQLDANTMWSLVDRNASQFGMLGEPIFVEQRVREQDDAAATYYVYEKEGVVWPEAAGRLTFDDVRVVMNYPQQLARDLFGDLRIARGQRLSVAAETVAITVKPLPEEGRPDDFNGAVGRYEISTSAQPTDVTVGDPITLTLRIRGSGRLQRVSAPLLSRVPALMQDFKVPDEPLAGRIDGSAKVFTQTIRATRPDVAAIPPIPLSFFDPQTGKYETARSQPIPIRVRPGASLSLSQVVEADVTRPRSPGPLIERTDGLLANFADIPAILEPQTAEFGRGWWMTLTVCPTLYAAIFFLHRRRERWSSDSAFRRRSLALRTAQQRLDDARRAGGSTAIEHVGRALTGYIADRLNLPPGTLTSADAGRLLAERGASADLAAEVQRLLAEVESMRYGGTPVIGDQESVRRADECLHRLERARL